jgi:hypothetical protein
MPGGHGAQRVMPHADGRTVRHVKHRVGGEGARRFAGRSRCHSHCGGRGRSQPARARGARMVLVAWAGCGACGYQREAHHRGVGAPLGGVPPSGSRRAPAGAPRAPAGRTWPWKREPRSGGVACGGRRGCAPIIIVVCVGGARALAWEDARGAPGGSRGPTSSVMQTAARRGTGDPGSPMRAPLPAGRGWRMGGGGGTSG